MPAVNYINIPFNSDVNKEIQIALVSITGKVVYTNTYNKNNITTGKITINLVHIPTGKYITRITIGNRSFNRPVIIIK